MSERTVRNAARRYRIGGSRLAPDLPLAGADPRARPVYGCRQQVSAAELTEGQAYLRALWRQHNRLSHGPGVAWGLEVFPAASAADGTPRVRVTRGYALSPLGDEIYAPEDQVVALDCEPAGQDRCRNLAAGPVRRVVYLGIRLAERPVCPAPLYADPCDPLPACEPRRVEAGCEIACLAEPPPWSPRTCQHWADALVCHRPPPAPDALDPLRACPQEDGSPWVVLCELELDARGQVSEIGYGPRQRTYASQLLGELARCLAAAG
ncbi:MAG: hypothetical protein GXY76_06615 [Chloroflexi bacterium]|nr:hypothetical protein [Chloroflexota bacterium]